MTSMKDLFDPLTRTGLIGSETVTGCTDAEIAELMRSQDVTTLPGSYREFLSYGGKTPYWLSRDGEWDYDWLLEAKDVAREIVTEDYAGDFSPFENTFVFQTHQGYMFYYFRSEDLGTKDPNFWIFEGDKPVRDSGTSFTAWLGELAAFLPKAVKLRRDLGMQ